MNKTVVKLSDFNFNTIFQLAIKKNSTRQFNKLDEGDIITAINAHLEAGLYYNIKSGETRSKKQGAGHVLRESALLQKASGQRTANGCRAPSG